MVAALAEALDKTIHIQRCGQQLDPWEAHCRVKEMYNWYHIAERTEKVMYIYVHTTNTCVNNRYIMLLLHHMTEVLLKKFTSE